MSWMVNSSCVSHDRFFLKSCWASDSIWWPSKCCMTVYPVSCCCWCLHVTNCSVFQKHLKMTLDNFSQTFFDEPLGFSLDHFDQIEGSFKVTSNWWNCSLFGRRWAFLCFRCLPQHRFSYLVVSTGLETFSHSFTSCLPVFPLFFQQTCFWTQGR